MRGEKTLVDLHAEAGLLQGKHAAVLADLEGLVHELVAKEIEPRDIRLEVAAVVDGREEMDTRGHVEPGHRGVGMDGKLPRAREGGDAQPLRDTAGLGEIG